MQEGEEEKTENQPQEVLLAQATTQGVSIMVEEQKEKVRFYGRYQTLLSRLDACGAGWRSKQPWPNWAIEEASTKER